MIKKILKILFFIVIALIGMAFILVYYPVNPQTQHTGISEERAAELREDFNGPHHTIVTTDGETLFLRRWNPDSTHSNKKEVALLILHGFTAHSGAYDMAGKPFSESGYTTFGMDYRGHGLSGGNRGDTPGTDRWITDMAETVAFIEDLGFSQIVVLGHSLGVASAFCVANKIPNKIAGVVLLSGAYESREGVSKPPSMIEQARFLASAALRPSYQSYHYYRDGMTVTDDSLFTMRYTPRFLMMLDVETLRLPPDSDIPVLVGVGDQDELFSVDHVKDLYDLIPGDKKEFLVMNNTTHSNIPRESWMEIVDWLDRTFTTRI